MKALAIALLLAGCASPCLSTVTTSLEGGTGRGTRSDSWLEADGRRDVPRVADGRDSAYDVRAGLSLEWDATGKACRP